jgi:hypothetical protein
MSRLSPIMTVEELHRLLFDLPGDTAVEVEAEMDITGDHGGGALLFPLAGPSDLSHPP